MDVTEIPFSAGRSMFRNPGMLGAATGGIGKAIASVFGNGGYQQGFDNELGLQSKLAQAMAAARAHDAQAAHFDAQTAAEQAKTGVLQGRPTLFNEQVANASGTDVPMVRAIRETMATGRAPQVHMGPPTEEGGMGVGSQQFDPGVRSKVASAIQQFLPLLSNAGDLAPDQLAHAAERFREMGLSDQVIADPTKAPAVFKGQAASNAKPLFHTDASGGVLDLGGGTLNTSNPMARSTIGLKGAQAGQANAAAADHLAGAGLKTAQTGAVGAGPGKAPSGYRYTSDPETGEVRLEPIPGGPKDPANNPGKPLPGTVSKDLLSNQQNLRRAQTALALIEGKSVGGVEGDPNATGWKGLLPNTVLNRVDDKGVATRAAIADLGSLIVHDRSGAAVTAAEFPRLAPFIPGATDDAATVKKKLAQFVKNYSDVVGEHADFYRSSGYNVPTDTLRNAQVDTPAATPAAPAPPAGHAKVASDADYAALPSGATFVGPDGKTRRKP